MPRRRITAALILALPVALQAQDDGTTFRWRGDMRAGTQVRVHSMNGSVRVMRGGSALEVVATREVRRGDPATVRFEARPLSNGDVVVCALWGREQECTDDGVRGTWRSTRNGPEISVEMVVRVPDGVRTLARTVNGDLDVRGVSAMVEASTVNGGVFVQTTNGPVTATTVNGSVEARMAAVAGGGAMKFTTVNGDVTLAIPATLGADVEARTVNGDISSDLPLTISGLRSLRRLQGTLHGGGRAVTLTTTNGSVRLLRGSI